MNKEEDKEYLLKRISEHLALLSSRMQELGKEFIENGNDLEIRLFTAALLHVGITTVLANSTNRQTAYSTLQGVIQSTTAKFDEAMKENIEKCE